MSNALLLGLALLLTGDDLYNPVADGKLPQYVFFHLTTPRLAPPPERFTADLLREIPRTIGTTGNSRLRLGVAYTFNILEQPPAELARSLRAMLRAAQEADVPVFLCLDGQNWWESRPDLWNWWDENKRGYDPRNTANVEWTGWGPEHAVRTGYRNWGREIRVAPAPNIASPALLAEHEKAFEVLVPLIVEWYEALPPDRKYLFGGLKVGWEASINVNAYSEPGNHKPERGWTFGQAPLGYNAVRTWSIKASGELTKHDIEAVVHRYLEHLSKLAFELGVPKHLIFTHQGGTYAPWEQHLSFKPAINSYSVPGWSFYSHDPPECGSMAADLESAGRLQWAAVEWLRKGVDSDQWRSHLERALSFKRCRLLSIYNWEGIRQNPAALQAIREVLSHR